MQPKKNKLIKRENKVNFQSDVRTFIITKWNKKKKIPSF